MPEPPEPAPPRRPVGERALIILGAAGAAAPLALWARGEPGGGAGRGGGAAVTLIGLGAWLARARESGRDGGPAAEPPPRRGARTPPFAAILEHLADPVLLVAGGDQLDLNS